MFTKTTKHCWKDIKENINKQKDTPCSWTGRLNIVKLAIPPLMYRFNAIPTEIPMAFSFSFFFPPRNEKANPKIYMELQGAQNSHNNIKKKSDSHFAKLLLENVLIQQHNPDSVAYTSTMTSGTALRVQRYICILRSTDFRQRHQGCSLGKEASSTNGAGCPHAYTNINAHQMQKSHQAWAVKGGL